MLISTVVSQVHTVSCISLLAFVVICFLKAVLTPFPGVQGTHLQTFISHVYSFFLEHAVFSPLIDCLLLGDYMGCSGLLLPFRWLLSVCLVWGICLLLSLSTTVKIMPIQNQMCVSITSPSQNPRLQKQNETKTNKTTTSDSTKTHCFRINTFLETVFARDYGLLKSSTLTSR